MGWGGTPWEGTLGSPKGFMGGDPWEREPLGAQGIPWEGTLGAPLGAHLKVFCDEVTFQ